MQASNRPALAARRARGHNACVSTPVPIRPAATVIVLRDAPADVGGGGVCALEVLLVQRASEKYALARTLNADNIAAGPFESLYWNIANWNRVE